MMVLHISLHLFTNTMGFVPIKRTCITTKGVFLSRTFTGRTMLVERQSQEKKVPVRTQCINSSNRHRTERAQHCSLKRRQSIGTQVIPRPPAIKRNAPQSWCLVECFAKQESKKSNSRNQETLKDEAKTAGPVVQW